MSAKAQPSSTIVHPVHIRATTVCRPTQTTRANAPSHRHARAHESNRRPDNHNLRASLTNASFPSAPLYTMATPDEVQAPNTKPPLCPRRCLPTQSGHSLPIVAARPFVYEHAPSDTASPNKVGVCTGLADAEHPRASQTPAASGQARPQRSNQ